jgi:predicted transcriptional regulator
METFILDIHEGLDSQDTGSAPDTIKTVSGSLCDKRDLRSNPAKRSWGYECPTHGRSRMIALLILNVISAQVTP